MTLSPPVAGFRQPLKSFFRWCLRTGLAGALCVALVLMGMLIPGNAVAQAVIALSPTSLTNTVQKGSNAVSQSFDLWNSVSSNGMIYTVSDTATWLSETPVNGTNYGSHDTITLNYMTTGLLAGSYAATVTVSSASATNSPQSVLMTLFVTNSVSLPVVANMGVSNVFASAATLNGFLSSTGGASTTVRFYWNKVDGGTNAAFWTNSILMGVRGTGIFTTNVTALATNTQYYYRSWASNQAGVAWAPTSTVFSTLAVLPVVNNTPGASNITASSAWVNGTLVSTGGAPTTVVIYWNKSDGGTNVMGWTNSVSFGQRAMGQFSAALTGLVGNTQYYYRSLASNQAGLAWAPVSTNFRTLSTCSFVVAGSPEAHGVSTPFDYGTNYVNAGTTLTNWVASPADETNGSRSVCMGWLGSGSVPPSGTESALAFTIATNSTLTWLWATQYQLDAQAGLHGAVIPSGAWFIAGSSTQITATADSGWEFAGWTGAVSPAQTNDNPVTVVMDQARSIVANFTRIPTTISATHASAGYRSPGTNVISCEFAYPVDRTLISLLWRPVLSNGWTLTAVWGDGAPQVNGNEILFTGVLTNNPVQLNYSFTAPASQSGAKEVVAEAEYQLDDMVNPDVVQANPGPLMIGRLVEFDVESSQGGAVPGLGVHSYVEGTVVPFAVTNSPAAEGAIQYVCTGWTGSGSVSGGVGTSGAVTLTDDSSLVWQWQTQYRLAATAIAGGSVTGAVGNWCVAGTTNVLVAVASNGCRFVNWTGDISSTANPLVVTMDHPYAVTANFELNQYTIAASSGPNGWITPIGSVGVNYGSNVNFSIAASNHYHVADVVVDSVSVGATNSYAFVAVTTNHSISASFAVDSYALTVYSPYGLMTPPQGTNVYNWGTVVPFAVTNSPLIQGATQYVCTGWSGTGSAATGVGANGTLTLTNDSSLVWQWQTQFRLDVSTVAGGQVSGSPAGWYDEGSTGMLTAIALDGFIFDGWAGDVIPAEASNATVSVIVNGPRSVTAQFHVDTAAVAVVQSCSGFYSPSTSLVVGCQFTYPAGQTVTALSYQPVLPAGWSLIGASGNGAPQVSGSNVVFVGALTNRPMTFALRLAVPGNEPIPRTLDGVALFRFTGMSGDGNVASPSLPVTRYHSADYDAGKWVLSGTELNRILAYWRAGGYYRNVQGYDGYAATNVSGLVASFRHSADYQGIVGAMDGVEVSRAIAYWTAGGYHADPLGDDGYASGPQGMGAGKASATTVSLTHKAPQCYSPGSEIAVTNVITYTDSLLSLYWKPLLPAFWTVTGVSGDGNPELVKGEIVWARGIPASPITFIYTVVIPVFEVGDKAISDDVQYFARNVVNAVKAGSSLNALMVTPADADADGLPDAWEKRFSGSVTGLARDADDDHDGMSNWQEYLAGTDPLNSNSALSLKSSAVMNGAVLLEWSSETNRRYRIESSLSLDHGFKACATNLPANPPRNSFTVESSGSPEFFRIEVEQP